MNHTLKFGGTCKSMFSNSALFLKQQKFRPKKLFDLLWAVKYIKGE